MIKIAYITTTITFILVAIFALLVKYWTGMVYFVLGLILLLSLFWAGVQIYRYFTEFKQEQAEKYKLFKAQTINKRQITTEIYNENEIAFKKEFSKKFLKDKLLRWGIIIFCFACAGAFLAGMILY